MKLHNSLFISALQDSALIPLGMQQQQIRGTQSDIEEIEMTEVIPQVGGGISRPHS